MARRARAGSDDSADVLPTNSLNFAPTWIADGASTRARSVVRRVLDCGSASACDAQRDDSDQPRPMNARSPDARCASTHFRARERFDVHVAMRWERVTNWYGQ